VPVFTELISGIGKVPLMFFIPEENPRREELVEFIN